jgi:hypothetical protein
MTPKTEWALAQERRINQFLHDSAISAQWDERRRQEMEENARRYCRWLGRKMQAEKEARP